MTAASLHSERVLTELDHVRLSKLLAARAHPALESLLDLAELMRSREVPADIVTMYSRVTIADARTGQRQQMTLCYPDDADPSKGFVSVLSPVGMGLIGLRLGAVAEWKTPGGGEVKARVEEILYQPEASGEFTV
jgi:regulator of nucleoside diphosphate kinase